MTSGFSVDVQALGKVAKAYQDTSDQWARLLKDLEGWKLGDGDLGVIGRRANVIGDYNTAVQTIIDKVRTSVTNLAAASKGLDAAADHYQSIEDASTDGLNKMAH
jgi:uncharacterized protein YukE